MSAATPSYRMLPGGELTDVLDELGVAGSVRDVLCFVSSRDPETFARAVAFAAPHALPERLRFLAQSTGGAS